MLRTFHIVKVVAQDLAQKSKLGLDNLEIPGICKILSVELTRQLDSGTPRPLVDRDSQIAERES